MGNSKVVKAALKEAKELIAKKQHKIALKSLNKALSVDRENYWALVMTGICQNETGNPELALKVRNRLLSSPLKA